MALIKKSEFAHLSKESLNEKYKDLKRELIRLNAQRAIGTTLESPGKIKLIRRTLAKINTILNAQKIELKEVKKTQA